MKKERGFLLIEVIIYFALFSIIMGGIVSGFYYLSANDERLNKDFLIVDESEFIFLKINWLLSVSSEVVEPSLDSEGNRLVVRDWNNKKVTLGLDEDKNIFLQYENETPDYLNSDRVKLENLFLKNNKNGLIEVSFEIDDENFQFYRFIYDR